MRIGVYSDSLPELGRRELFAWCAERRITDIELGVGAWGPLPRPHLDLARLGDAAERDRLRGELAEHGLRLGAVNAAGNVLHPDPAKRADAQARLTAAVELAAALGVKRVVTMSGCPAGPGGGGLGVFPCWGDLVRRREPVLHAARRHRGPVLAGDQRLAGEVRAGADDLPRAASGRHRLQPGRLLPHSPPMSAGMLA